MIMKRTSRRPAQSQLLWVKLTPTHLKLLPFASEKWLVGMGLARRGEHEVGGDPTAMHFLYAVFADRASAVLERQLKPSARLTAAGRRAARLASWRVEGALRRAGQWS